MLGRNVFTGRMKTFQDAYATNFHKSRCLQLMPSLGFHGHHQVDDAYHHRYKPMPMPQPHASAGGSKRINLYR
jgi:hypothetical protein